MDLQESGIALLGGALIGASASLMLMLNGRIAGISGIVAGLLPPNTGERGWRSAFVGGLLLMGALLHGLDPSLLGETPVPIYLVAIAGLLVGFGTRLGSGCTSGHGVCGVSRLSRRSIVATITFVLTGMLTTFAMQRLLGVGVGVAP